jgi:Tol biopolymer transport system component
MRTFLLIGLTAIVAGGVPAQSSQSRPEYSVAYASFGPVATALYIADADGHNERQLLDGSVLDMNPSFSPDGRSVLFTSRRNGSADIYRVNADGTGLERLTDDSAFDDQAVMSPNGRDIAFVSSRSGQADIWILDVTTRRLRNVTNHPAGDYRPSWSPDGAWIAFTSDRGSDGAQAETPGRSGRFAPPQRTQIFVVRADGSGLRQITSGERSAGSATWSRDGSEIAFYEAGPQDWPAMSRDFPGPPPGTSQIVSVAVATGARRPLTTGPGRKFLPRWLGANRIAYLFGDADPVPGARERVIPVAARIAFTDGGASPTGRYTNVHWSHDGRQIVFHRALDAVWPPPAPAAPARSRDAAFSLVRTGIFPSYAPDGGRLVSNTAYAGLFHNSIMVASPDGADRRVLFLTHTAGLVTVNGLVARRPVRPWPLTPTDTLASYIPRLAGLPLDFQPGTQWSYSALAGADVLGRVVEIASGHTYDQFLERRIFDPLGMKDTFFYLPEDRRSRLVSLSDSTPSGMRPLVERVSTSSGAFFGGGAGLQSTAEPYLRFAQMLANDGILGSQTLLSAKTVRLMTTDHLGDVSRNTGPEPGIGQGLLIGTVEDPIAAGLSVSAGSFGLGGTFGTQVWIDPKEKLVMILMIQSAPANNPLRRDFENAVMQSIVW